MFSTYLEFEKIYERLDIQDLIDRGESFYQDMMGPVVKLLDNEGDYICYMYSIQF